MDYPVWITFTSSIFLQLAPNVLPFRNEVHGVEHNVTEHEFNWSKEVGIASIHVARIPEQSLLVPFYLLKVLVCVVS